MHRARAAGLLAVAIALSGCLGLGGDGGTAEPPAATADEPMHVGGGDGQAPLADGVLAAFAGIEPLHEVRWLNGTFELHQSADVTGVMWELGQPHPGYVVTDISDLVPAGVPVLLQAEVDADVSDGDVDLWFNMPQEEVWAAAFDAPYGGWTFVEYAIVREPGSPLTVDLFYDELDTSASFDYTLRVDVWAHPSVVPPGIPLALDLPGPGTTLTFEVFHEPDDAAVLLFAPDDSFLGRHTVEGPSLTITLPDDAQPGAYVYMFAAGAYAGQLNVSGPGVDEVVPRPVHQVITASEPVRFDPTTTEGTFAFDAPTTPLQTGFMVHGGDVALDLAAGLRSPSATLLDVVIEGGPWLGPMFNFNTPMGAEGLEAGTYEASFAWGQNAALTEDVVGMGWVVTYAR